MIVTTMMKMEYATSMENLAKTKKEMNVVMKTKKYNCHNCGYINKIPRIWIMLKYVLFGKNHQYYRCQNCQTVHSFFIYSNIVKDNADENLKFKNEVKTLNDWKNP